MKRDTFTLGRYKVQTVSGYMKSNVAYVSCGNNSYSFEYSTEDEFEKNFLAATDYMRKNPVTQLELTPIISKLEESTILQLQ